ncbi:hypothetical protein [Photorhabdus heterorhabditis]|uniref:Uncharacterized protein n=1 Tax=Photorhabdus heterorhabditis TaxID=880156 RepID=A0A5B0W5B9_9GAMM|nr:hypothetical protein [Photorhabdus heterorhabditis]KAA1181331.1 hypothetical protein F0L16_17105 [Photorhabdus heterorhabditis]
MLPTTQLVLSGTVHPSKIPLANIGDVAIHPGAGRTPFIDATIFDGMSWRNLDLNGFGFSKNSRNFDRPQNIGPIMRKIQIKIISCKGSLVYYDYPIGSKKRKYIYQGMTFPSFT